MTDTTTRAPRRTVLAGLLAVVVVVVAAVVWRATADEPDATPGARGVPYVDPQAAGAITLCSADGEAVTGGSIDDRPLAAYAVGETGLPSGVDPAGAVATLFGYQPRAGVAPGEFSGIPLTAAGTLTDPARPSVEITDDVYSVRDFVTAFPATDDGFVQLRLYLGTSDAGTLTESPYDTADLRVDGDRWELVDGGTAACPTTP